MIVKGRCVGWVVVDSRGEIVNLGHRPIRDRFVSGICKMIAEAATPQHKPYWVAAVVIPAKPKRRKGR
jgi:hypothetical protein